MVDIIESTLPYLFPVVAAWCLYQLERDHKRRAIGVLLRTELGVAVFAISQFFDDWKKIGHGKQVLKFYKDSKLFETNTKVYYSNLSSIHLLGKDLLVNITLLYSQLDRFEKTPSELLLATKKDGYTEGDSIFDGAHRHLSIIIPQLYLYSLPWYRRYGLSPHAALKIEPIQQSPVIYGSCEVIPQLMKTKKVQKGGN